MAAKSLKSISNEKGCCLLVAAPFFLLTGGAAAAMESVAGDSNHPPSSPKSQPTLPWLPAHATETAASCLLLLTDDAGHPWLLPWLPPAAASFFFRLPHEDRATKLPAAAAQLHLLRRQPTKHLISTASKPIYAVRPCPYPSHQQPAVAAAAHGCPLPYTLPTHLLQPPCLSCPLPLSMAATAAIKSLSAAACLSCCQRVKTKAGCANSSMAAAHLVFSGGCPPFPLLH